MLACHCAFSLLPSQTPPVPPPPRHSSPLSAFPSRDCSWGQGCMADFLDLVAPSNSWDCFVLFRVSDKLLHSCSASPRPLPPCARSTCMGRDAKEWLLSYIRGPTVEWKVLTGGLLSKIWVLGRLPYCMRGASTCFVHSVFCKN